MKSILLFVGLVSFVFSGEFQNEITQKKQILAKKYDNAKKIFVQSEKHSVKNFPKISKKEMLLQKEISKPLGVAINEDQLKNYEKKGN